MLEATVNKPYKDHVKNQYDYILSFKNKWLVSEITNKERIIVTWGKFSNDNIILRFKKCWRSSSLDGSAAGVL